MSQLLAGVSALGIILVASVGAMPARAAEAEAAAEAGAPEAGEIVVTALRRADTIQTAPLSIAALTGESLGKTGSTQLSDYFRQVPNLNVTAAQGGSARLSIRGVNSAGEATVGLYYDETPVTGPSGTSQDSGGVAADLNLFDVERVEVLRGPQGTLYGSSSMAGTLRVIFTKPDASGYDVATEAQATTTKGGSVGWFTKAMVNAPVIADKMALRIVGYYEQRPGWIDSVKLGHNNVNDQTNWGVRGLLSYKPDGDTIVLATAIYQKGSGDDQQGWYPSVGHFKTNSPTVLPFNSKMQLYNLKGDHDFGPVTLTATASWYKYEFLRAFDFTPSTFATANSPASCRAANGGIACTPAQMATFTATGVGQLPAIGYQPAFVRTQTYEVRLASSDEMPEWLQWTVGGYYEKRHDHIDSQTVRADPATGEVYQPLRYFQFRYVETNLRQAAGFGELSLKPVTGLTLTAGARYYDYKKQVGGESYFTNFYVNAVKTPYSEVEANSHGWLEKFNISYAITPRVMIYGTASKGFRPGGANNIPTLPVNLAPYRPDSLWNYELGFKSSWMGNALVFNAAVFDIEWSNMQTQARTADGLYAFLTNAGKARIRGAEVDVTVRPMAGLMLTGSGGYVDAKLREDQSSASVLVTASTGRKGDLIPNTPKWTASGSANYSWALSTDLDGLLRADLAYTGHMQSNFRPTDPFFTTYGGYATLNLRAGVEQEKWGIYVFCQNVTDSTGNLNVSNGFGYTGLSYSIAPRTFGINIRYRL